MPLPAGTANKFLTSGVVVDFQIIVGVVSAANSVGSVLGIETRVAIVSFVHQFVRDEVQSRRVVWNLDFARAKIGEVLIEK